MFHFKSFRTRIVFTLLILLVAVLGLVYLSVSRSTTSNTRTVINESLIVGKGIFQQLLDERTETLVVTNRALSNDDAFRTAYFTHEYETILDLSINHLNRIQTADMMMIVNLDYQVEADTSRIGDSGHEVPWPELIDAADDSDNYEATSVVVMNGTAYQMLVVPLLSPDLRAWVLIGRKLDDKFVAELKTLTTSEVSILVVNDNAQSQILASTLNTQKRDGLAASFGIESFESEQTEMLNLQDEEYVSLLNPLVDENGVRVVALLQRSLEEAFEPYRALEKSLLILFFIALVISALSAIVLGRSVTQPILALAKRVKLIEQGDYSNQTQLMRKDELGQLSDSVNKMAGGLAEKERVRDLLGKVVSPEIAEELLSKDITLGGEERVVTILFSDIRNFTNLCEGKAAEEVLSLLNRYLTDISTTIESNKGVVDKYVGDAVMALYGAPVQHSNDKSNALNSAIEMMQALRQFNIFNQEHNLPQFEAGIGIHTGAVVAGNLGSTNRMNYTVIGDAVNLSARLEALTKQYGVGIIISEDSLVEDEQFIYRELDAVVVKGRQQSIKIYELVGSRSSVTDSRLEEIETFQKMLSFYKKRQWSEAEELLTQLKETYPFTILYKLYLKRITEFKESPPEDNWDGSYTFTSK